MINLTPDGSFISAALSDEGILGTNSVEMTLYRHSDARKAGAPFYLHLWEDTEEVDAYGTEVEMGMTTEMLRDLREAINVALGEG
jgi:hypothetical protein